MCIVPQQLPLHQLLPEKMTEASYIWTTIDPTLARPVKGNNQDRLACPAPASSPVSTGLRTFWVLPALHHYDGGANSFQQASGGRPPPRSGHSTQPRLILAIGRCTQVTNEHAGMFALSYSRGLPSMHDAPMYLATPASSGLTSSQIVYSCPVSIRT